MKPGTSRNRQSAFRIGAIMLAVVVGVAIALAGREIRYRFFPVYVEDSVGHRLLYDRTLGWRNIPIHRAETIGRPLHINAHGLRDRHYPFKKPDGTQRILVLGDSYPWGYGVSDQEIFTEVLEAALTNHRGPWEVINSGVLGWGTDQEYLYFINEGVRYEPDIVVLALFVVNDVDSNNSNSYGGLYKPVFRDEQLQPVSRSVPRPGSDVPLITSDASPVDLTIAIIKALAAACRQANSRLIVMKFGAFLQDGGDDAQHPFKRLQRRIEQLPNVDGFDLDEALAGRGLATEQITLDGDPHWNAFGHQQVAELLHKYLLDQALVPPSQGDR